MSMPIYFSDDNSLLELTKHCSKTTEKKDCPQALNIINNVPIYSASTFLDSKAHSSLRNELNAILRDGSGVFAIKKAMKTSIIDTANQLFQTIVASEKNTAKGDHFGQNERIWNAFEKVCLLNPQAFIDYYDNACLQFVAMTWLGPAFQITAQMNTVKPNGKAQTAHRDYHLGFQSKDTTREFPAHAQMMSQYLTLQGAIAHTDMPQETGPTKLLPFSQNITNGYLTYRDTAFQDYFEEHYVQVPLEKGDMLFFNPALFHAAGNNSSDNNRIANLLQISSCFGKPMEYIDRQKMISALYPNLQQLVKTDQDQCQRVIEIVADGYSFPTNLDIDPPEAGKPPKTKQQILFETLLQGDSYETYLRKCPQIY